MFLTRRLTRQVRRTTGRRRLQWLLVAPLVGILAACGSAGARPAPEVLHWSNEGISDIYTLDPAAGPDFNARQAVQLIFGGLVRFGPRFEILPDAAERWSLSDHGRTYTFYLRRSVRFGDGHTLTAADVAYSLNRTLSPPFALQSGTFLSGIVGAPRVMGGAASSAAGIGVVNSRVLRIRLAQPDGSFLAKLANPPGDIVPRWRIKQSPRGWYQHAIGTGPFMVSRWVHNNALLLAPNPYYYGGRLAISGIDMPFIPEPLAAYKRYRSGGVDIMGIVHFPTEVLYDVQGHADFHPSPRLETVFLTLNEHVAPFNNRLVRLAFARAVDKTSLVRTVYEGFAHPTDGMMPPGLPGYSPRLGGAHYSPALARRLLAEAGYPAGRDLPEILYPIDQDAQSAVLAHALAAQWRRLLGVRVRPIQYTHSAYLNLLTHNQYQLAVIDWTADYPDPENFVSQQLDSNSPNNNGGWSNRTFDRLTAEADAMPPNEPRRFALYRRAEEIAMQDAATIPLVNPKAGILVRNGVQGMQVSGGILLVRDWSRVRAPVSGAL